MSKIKGASMFPKEFNDEKKEKNKLNNNNERKSSRTSMASSYNDNAKDLFGDATDHPNAESSFEDSEGF